MKRFYIAAIAGLCAVAPGRAQDGALAPTAPVVPPPVLQNGSVIAPDGATWGPSTPRLFSKSTWSPVRNPVVPGELNSVAYPPLPSGIGAAPCGPAGCGAASCGRGGFNWERLKSWLCFHNTPTSLPRMRPTPYVTPLQGMFSCSSAGGCAPCGVTGQQFAPYGQPQPAAPLMPAPMKPPGTAGAVLMPMRGTMGAPAPTAWQNATVAGQTDFGTAKGTTSANWQKPATGPVVNTGYRTPSK